jgi:hypothetical protein
MESLSVAWPHARVEPASPHNTTKRGEVFSDSLSSASGWPRGLPVLFGRHSENDGNVSMHGVESVEVHWGEKKTLRGSVYH